MRKTQGELIAIGLDVSKDSLSVCERYEKEKKCYEIKNSKKEINRFAKQLKKMDYRGKIVMESTGRYHLLTALILREKNLDARVINPLIAKKYSSSSIRKVKTDKRDSEVLSQVALMEERLPGTFNVSKEEIIMKKKISMISMLDKELQKMKASSKEFGCVCRELEMPCPEANKGIIKAIEELEKQKRELEKELIASAKEVQNRESQRYATIPGVSIFGGTIFSLFFNSQYDTSSKKWIGFAGIDVSVRESGHWKGKAKLTKRGNKYLRKRLFQAGWGAVRHDENFRQYYNKLREKGKGYADSIIIISKKLVRIMFSLALKQEDYDPSKVVFGTV